MAYPLAAAVIFAATPALAESVSMILAWYAPIQSSIAGYGVHIGKQSGVYTRHHDVDLPKIAISSIPEGANPPGVPQHTIWSAVQFELGFDYYIAVSTYSDNGTVSPYSKEMLITAEELEAIRDSSEAGDSVPIYPGVEAAATNLLYGLGMDSPESDLTIEMPRAFDVSRDLNNYLHTGAEFSVCDLEGDGVLDILLGNVVMSERWRANGAYSAHVRVFSHTDETTFAPVPLQASGLLGDNFIDTHAVCADLDGDGWQELLISTGAGGGSKIQIFDDLSTKFDSFSIGEDSLGVLQVGQQVLSNGGNGAIRTAVGDIDGDGYAEIVVTFAAPFANQVLILDDIHHGFAPMSSPYLKDGYIYAGLDSSMGDFAGVVAPLVMDVDRDGTAEIVIVYGDGEEMRMTIFDDAESGFLRLH